MSIPFVPFIRGLADEDIYITHYNDAEVVRVCLDRSARLSSLSSAKRRLWIDVGLDGIADAYSQHGDKNWKNYIARYGDLTPLLDPVFLSKPDRKKIEPVIVAMLDSASMHLPVLISIPQLPYEDGAKNNKINRLLAEIAADWRKSHPQIKLILPFILTSQHQLNTKTERNPLIKQAAGICSKFGVDAVWSVDHTLEDQAGTGNFDRTRFPGVISFFQELRAAITLEMIVAGPYWGLGLVLWSRGLVTHFGIGMGNSYRYHLPGGVLMDPKARIAIGSLRRWTSSTLGLKDWLLSEQTKLPPGSAEQNEMRNLYSQYPALLDAKVSKKQVAKTYRQWLDKILSTAPAGRPVALYQDLSGAFITGKALKDLPDENGPGRRPERIAEQLMLNCL
jgi:hypothetical protein